MSIITVTKFGVLSVKLFDQKKEELKTSKKIATLKSGFFAKFIPTRI